MYVTTTTEDSKKLDERTKAQRSRDSSGSTDDLHARWRIIPAYDSSLPLQSDDLLIHITREELDRIIGGSAFSEFLQTCEALNRK
jgi:hypothetical protein